MSVLRQLGMAGYEPESDTPVAAVAGHGSDRVVRIGPPSYSLSQQRSVRPIRDIGYPSATFNLVSALAEDPTPITWPMGKV